MTLKGELQKAKRLVRKIFQGEMLIRTLQTTPLQISFWNIVKYNVIGKSIVYPDANCLKNSSALGLNIAVIIMPVLSRTEISLSESCSLEIWLEDYYGESVGLGSGFDIAAKIQCVWTLTEYCCLMSTGTILTWKLILGLNPCCWSLYLQICTYDVQTIKWNHWKRPYLPTHAQSSLCWIS